MPGLFEALADEQWAIAMRGCVVLLAHPARRQEALADRDHHLWAAPSWPAYEIVAVDTSQGLWAYADSGPVGFSEGTSVLPDAPPSTVTAGPSRSTNAWRLEPPRSNTFAFTRLQ